ncbi:hypothetical protein B0919_19280 [Hymenobacter sp. CRA2]|nr:hypothetical protein B0919_19280 [Hymenobacter sp. CRA2]
MAICLTLLILLQSFSRELLVMDYALHKERITQLFCVNKDKPQLHCNGKCHLRRQLAQSAAEKKTPDRATKLKLDAALVPTRLVFTPAVVVLASAEYAVLVGSKYGHEAPSGIFRPPVS